MKTLKELIKEVGQTSGTPGAGNWSLSGPDLAKQWSNPGFKDKLTTKTNTSPDQLLKRISPSLGAEAFVNMSDQDVDLFVKKLNQYVDAMHFQAKKMKEKDAQLPPTNPGGKKAGTLAPQKGGTNPAIPSKMDK